LDGGEGFGDGEDELLVGADGGGVSALGDLAVGVFGVVGVYEVRAVVFVVGFAKVAFQA